ncbi:MAG: prephenate dehydrogenase, partial [Micrococcales bacterium]
MSRIKSQVRIVGAGLLGTSIGLALTKLGVDVIIASQSKASTALAIDYGAGRAASDHDQPALIVVCVPPDITADIVSRELNAFPNAVVTDVASVKGAIIQDLEKSNADLSRFVGSHPMAGREKGGAASGRADLFVGRPWVVVPTDKSTSKAIDLVTDLALDLQSAPIQLDAHSHDRAVANVSHVPQLVASLLAAQLNRANVQDLNLAGQGLRDTTRIAASDPKLWVQILSANAQEISPILKNLLADLELAIDALENPSKAGSLTAISETIQKGNQGVERIPGKHGGRASHYAQVIVMVDDKPGELGRLFTEMGQIGINLEDFKLEHSPGAPIGLAELSVLPEQETKLVTDLTERGWR